MLGPERAFLDWQMTVALTQLGHVPLLSLTPFHVLTRIEVIHRTTPFCFNRSNWMLLVIKLYGISQGDQSSPSVWRTTTFYTKFNRQVEQTPRTKWSRYDPQNHIAVLLSEYGDSAIGTHILVPQVTLFALHD
jgi:hypothetical protein